MLEGLYRDLLFRFRMTEARRTHVLLLDDRRLEILIQPKLYAGELLDMVASHFNIKEKEYFGLAFLDDMGHYNWLQLDHRVLDHDFPKKPAEITLSLHFLVKYFVESIVQLRHSATVEAFYLQAKSHVSKGLIEADSETVFQLAALALQASFGDFTDEETTKAHLKKLSLIPPATWKEHPSLSYCEDKVVTFYKSVEGQSRGQAIVNYVTIVESLPTYGVHYYQVKDKSGMPWWLGISYKGITQCDHSDKKTPRKVFLWKQLENLLFRDRKFSIEVRDPRRVIHTLSSFNLYEDAIEKPLEEFDPLAEAICDPTTQVSVSRRTLGPGNVKVYVWFAATPALTKCIWSMAIAQHQFYLDRKAVKKAKTTVDQIAEELSRSVHSLSSQSSISNLSRSASCNSLPIIPLESSEEAKAAAQEMLAALKARKEALEEALGKKTEELQSLCQREEELLARPATRVAESDSIKEEQEKVVQSRRKVETAFTLNDQLLLKAKESNEELLAKLELDFEIQSKITSAALQLANRTSRKSLRKKRMQSYDQAHAKLLEIEKKLASIKRKNGDSESLKENDSNKPSPSSYRSEKASIHSNCSPTSRESATQLPWRSSNSAPSSPTKQRATIEEGMILRPRGQFPFPPSRFRVNHSTYTPGGGSDYDNISTSSGSIISLQVPYKNRFESTLDIENSNTYNVSNRRTSQVFDSPDQRTVSDQASTSHLDVSSNLYASSSSSLSERNSLAAASDYRIHKDNGASGLVNLDTSCHNSDAPISFNCHPSGYPHHGAMKSAQSYRGESIMPRSRHPSLPRKHRRNEWHSNSHSSENIQVYACPGPDVVDGPLPSSCNDHNTGNHWEASNHVMYHQPHKQVTSPPALRKYTESHHHPYVPNAANHFVPHIHISSGPNTIHVEDSHAIPMMPKSKSVSSCISDHLSSIKSANIRADQSVGVPESHYSLHSGLLSPTSATIHSHNQKKTEVQNLSGTLLRFHSVNYNGGNQASSTSISKPKTKEWIESSLDSPIISRKAPKEALPSSPPPQAMIENCHAHPHSPSITPSPTMPLHVPPLSPNYKLQNGVEVNIVSVGHFQPYWEETKPYETSDFYKYSTKHRKNQATPPNSNLSVSRSDQSGNLSSEGERSFNLDSSKSPPEIGRVAESFHDEMWAWYEDQEKVKRATLV